ncbi:MAG: aminoacyl-tRNA hydrolase [Treponema sp.]|jgi:PTH1 family peptidyl-tRNA hydrolase|nr:aminoacyl-tRNA hydrolase [Treponema sp.]
MIELVACLGNPGREYTRNRHNAGWLLAERLPVFSSLNWQQKYHGRYASMEGSRLLVYDKMTPGSHGTELSQKAKLHVLMPETYMNCSGDSVYQAAAFFKIPPERILLVHDELELPLGTAALKFSGGLGGHNGLRSMKARFGAADFWRLRIGIGRPNHEDIAGWVLSDFTADEQPILEHVLDACADALLQALINGPESLLPAWNKRKIVDPLQNTGNSRKAT